MDYDLLEAWYVRDHVVWVRCRDGTVGEVDVAPALRGEVFAPLRDVEYFKRFTVSAELGTIAWPNAADIAPEYLHEEARAHPAPPPPTRELGTFGGVMVAVEEPPDRTVGGVPIISRFFGIVVTMYHRDHGVAHFHARYGGHVISVEVESGRVHGTFPPRALRLVHEWAAQHREELLANWQLAREQKPVTPIAPLE